MALEARSDSVRDGRRLRPWIAMARWSVDSEMLVWGRVAGCLVRETAGWWMLVLQIVVVVVDVEDGMIDLCLSSTSSIELMKQSNRFSKEVLFRTPQITRSCDIDRSTYLPYL